MQDQVPSGSGISEQFMHKNRLQEFAQKTGIPLPTYQTVNEGSDHAPKFRATVVVDGATYCSQETFLQRKAAEQDVARIALTKIIEKGCSLTNEVAIYSKAILNEYAVKMSLDMPMYVTSPSEGGPSFKSSLEFNSRHHCGVGRSKKEAEQQAARSAILSILGTPDTKLPMYEIIKSKRKLFTMNEVNNANISHDVNVGNGSNLGAIAGGSLSVEYDVGNMLQMPIAASVKALPAGEPANQEAKQPAQLDLAKQDKVLTGLSCDSTINTTHMTSQLIHESHNEYQCRADGALPPVGASSTDLESQSTGVHTVVGKKHARGFELDIQPKKVHTNEP